MASWELETARFVAVVVLLAAASSLALLFAGLFVQGWWQAHRERLKNRLSLQLSDLVACSDAAAIPPWVEQCGPLARTCLSELVLERLAASQGNTRKQMAELYVTLGFAGDDRRRLRSMNWKTRLRAMRRLFIVAGFEEREELLGALDDHYLMRVLAAHALARSGEVNDVLRALNALDLHSNLMEAPVYALLKYLPRDRFSELFANWENITSARVRRVVLVTAASQGLPRAATMIERLAKDPDVEVRIGVCIAASRLKTRCTLDFLFVLLKDEAWEVRAKAARALASHPSLRALEPLSEAMNDPAFWVRQNAALAMQAVGLMGQHRLDKITAGSDAHKVQVWGSEQEITRFRAYLELNMVWVADAAGEDVSLPQFKADLARTSQ